MRVVVENSIGAIKKWHILQRYRHYRIDHDEYDRARLGQVVRVIAAIVNWRSRTSGKPRRLPGWHPSTNKEYLRKLLTEADTIGARERTRFHALLEGKQTPLELGLMGARLTAEQELLLASKGDTTETWQIIEEVKGVVVLRSDDGNMKVVRAESRAAASAASAAAAAVTPASSSSSARKRAYVDLDQPSQ